MSEQDLFTPAEVEFDPNSNYVDQLVGDGKKFSDPNKLAFGKLQSDRFIERLKTENERMREELNTRQRMEELVTKLASIEPKQSASSENNQGSERDGDNRPPMTGSGLSPEEAEALFNRKLRETKNFEKSLEGLKSAYGSDYQTKLDEEAKRLGMDSTEVNSLAKANPELFLRIFSGTNVTPSDNHYTPPPTNSINSNSLVSLKNNHMVNGVRTQAYYNDLKARDPKTYWSVSVQQQEMKDATKLGEAWFNAS
jgi:hypothetical protein